MSRADWLPPDQLAAARERDRLRQRRVRANRKRRERLNLLRIAVEVPGFEAAEALIERHRLEQWDADNESAVAEALRKHFLDALDLSSHATSDDDVAE